MSSSTSSCMISEEQPSRDPTLGSVRPKSPWQNSLTYVPACVTQSSCRKRAESCVAVIAWIVRSRTMSVRRCMTRIGVSCCTTSSRVPLSVAMSAGVMARDSASTQRYSLRWASSPSFIRDETACNEHSRSPLIAIRPQALMRSCRLASSSAVCSGRLGASSSIMNGRPRPSMRTSTSSRPAEWNLASLAPKSGTACSVMHSATEPAHLILPSTIHGDCGRERENLQYRPVSAIASRSMLTATVHGADAGRGGHRAALASRRWSAVLMPSARSTAR
mmetsp:Transcript_33105/g.86984  ORF Transcript_33105/g.86984 Transcript_33105/m.86984 type:complete len:276 (+) Transcript_33105:339-1166(+)